MTRILAYLQQKRHMDLPVLVQEMRIRQRGVRPFVVTTIYVVVLSIIALLFIYRAHWTGMYNVNALPELGEEVFLTLLLVQLGIISLLVPAYSSAAVTSEREKGTFELLALTLLPSGGIIRQKLTAAIAEILMLLFASVPIVSMVFMFGGVSPTQLALAFTVLAVTAVLLGSFGILCSCLLSKTRTATLAAYVGMFTFLLLLPIGTEWLKSVTDTGFMRSTTAFPLIVVGVMLFVGGLGALVLYSLALVILKPRVKLWFVRAFRMAVFGICYIMVFLVIAVPSLSTLAIQVLYGADEDISLPMMVNPFVAVVSLVEDFTPQGMETAIIVSTIVFGIACTYLFLNLSVRRFALLRRS